jgi:hypothetical protein
MADEAALDRRLRVAAGIAAAEAIVLAGEVAVRSGGRTMLLAASVVVKLPFCVLAARRSAGGILGLLFWEATALFYAIVAPGTPIVGRVLVGASAATVLVLLARSAGAIPAPRLPGSDA